MYETQTYEGLRKEYYKYRAETPALKDIDLEDAIRRLLVFMDNPEGEVENEIDSILIGYQTEFLEEYLEFFEEGGLE
jgi:hypothetical protein